MAQPSNDEVLDFLRDRFNLNGAPLLAIFERAAREEAVLEGQACARVDYETIFVPRGYLPTYVMTAFGRLNEEIAQVTIAAHEAA